jgi:hypothetical protein
VVAARTLTALIVLLGVVSSPSHALECIAIDDFTRGKVGELPPDWRLRQDSGRGVYALREEDGRRFLHAGARGVGVQAMKPFAWDLRAYPVLAWSWRPIEFPGGADERRAATNDSVLAVYAVFAHTKASLRALKYVWSLVVPPATHLSSNVGLTQVLVARSGTDGAGRWIEERANVLEDYRRYFGTVEVPKPEGIAVLTDSDDTMSSAQGDYADFRACRP